MTDSIESRLRRIYASIGVVVETDIQSTVKYVQEGTNGRISFDKDITADEVENNAYLAISLLAHFPDHLIRWLRSNRQDTSQLDDLVKYSKELKAIKDLANTEKHGGFDRNGGHSCLKPRLSNIHRWMRLEPKPDGSEAVIKINFPEGTITHVSGDPLQVVIDADVLDQQGTKICTLTWLLESSLHQFEAFNDQLRAV